MCARKSTIEVGIRFGTVEDFLKKKSGNAITVNAEAVSSIFSEERIRLLKEIKTGVYNVSDLSSRLDRRIEHVSRDLAYLEKYGIIVFEKKGREKIPRVANHNLTIDI